MANPGVGSKFVSVNLNKSYGQPSSSLGNAGASRVRQGSHGGGGGGMVVLSRQRNSIVGAQKGGPRLAVPPPLNLPSLRKEHERFDPSSSGAGSAGAGGSASGSKPTSSGIGWMKQGPSTLQEKDGGGDHPLLGRSGGGAQAVDGGDLPSYSADAVSTGSSVYVPPSARSGTVGPPIAGSAHVLPPVEKAVVLRGEDFPSLQATLPATPGPAPKQKDNLHQKQKQKVNPEASDEQTESSTSRPLLHMRPQMQSSRLTSGNGLNENDGVSRELGGSSTVEQSRKQDAYFPGPLPLVRLNHTSDWADDERDTGHSLPDRGKDHGFSRSEAFRNRDFDIPRGGVLPRAHLDDLSSGWGLRGDEGGKISSKEVLRPEAYSRDVRTPSREGRDGSSWRASPLRNDAYSAFAVEVERNGVGARTFIRNQEMNRENKYNQSSFGDNSRAGLSSGIKGHRDLRFRRGDLGCGQGSRQNGNHVVESFGGRGAEQNMRDQYGGELSNGYRGDVSQNSLMPKTSFPVGGKGFSVNDPIFNFRREKRLFSNSGKSHHDDPFLKDFGSSPGFDGRDPLSGGFVGMLKKKKDVPKQADFHDPVRESFEAELERVQKMQEQERQRIIEEQERALELARKEEEERERLAREEEEQRRRLEEEAREAAWRAEQERLEAVRRAEEQKMAREEEKQRILMEDDRRKEAARRKLLELEARIARRRDEAVKDDKFPAAVGEGRMVEMVKEKDVSRVANVGDWEDGERMVERFTGSASPDSSCLNRFFEEFCGPDYSRDGNSAFLERGRLANSWRRDEFENVNSSKFLPQGQDDYHSPKRDAFGAGRAFSRKGSYGGVGVMSSRTASKGGVSEPHIMDNDFSHMRGHRWNLSGDGDFYSRNLEIDSEFHENTADRFGDVGWGQGHSRGSSHAPYPERFYQNSELDRSPFGRSRHSVRQPRVLPPPSLASSMHKSSFRGETELPSTSVFLDTEMGYHHAPRRNEPIMQTRYVSGYQPDQSEIMEAQQKNTVPEEHKLEKTATPRCDSQSSLSVSSPPSSPTHLSHDELDDSGDSLVLPSAVEGKEIPLSDNKHVATKAVNAKMITISSSVPPGEDDEWAIEDNEELQEQEEYDEEEDGYQEEDEVHEGDDENVELPQEFEDLHLEEKDTSHKMGQLVLGFSEGVEVGVPRCDEFERTSGNGEKAVRIEQMAVGIAEELGSFDRLVGNGQSFQPENDSPNMNVESSSKTFEDPEKTLQDLVLQPVNAASSTSASFVDYVETSTSFSIPVLQPVASSGIMALPSPAVQSVMSSVSAVPSQAEVPIKLQFGLFSGPSLIPSPVPAIQIGSIQMPLHLHPQVGPSLTQIHPPQPPLFQFGQLRYTSPISQGILPMAPQSMSFAQPTVQVHYSLNQNQGGPPHNQADQATSAQNSIVKDKASSVLMDDQPSLVPKFIDLSHENICNEVTVLPVRGGTENVVLTSQNQAGSSVGEKKNMPDAISQDQGHGNMAAKKNYRSIPNKRKSQGRLQSESTSSQFILSGSKAPGPISGDKGKKFIYTRNSGLRSFPVPEAASTDASGFQRRSQRYIRRTEFRVRGHVDRRQTEGVVSSNNGLDEKLNLNGKMSGISVRSGAKKDITLVKPSKEMVSLESSACDSISSRVVDSERKMEKGREKEAPTQRITSVLGTSHSGEGNLKRHSCFDDDVDAPLQSGVVRVFKQPGIEAPSDEDDFIEVRSKRQMLNDRREQREKEIKAKSRVVKAPRKPRSVSQNTVVSANSKKIPTSLVEEAERKLHSESNVTDGRIIANIEVSAGFTSTMISQPWPPIGTPVVNTDTQADIRSHTIKSLQTGFIPVTSSGGTNFGPVIEDKNVVLDSVQTSLCPWSNAQINKQVMALTQTQLDNAMNSARVDSHVTSIGDHTSSVIEPSKPLPSILTQQDKSFSSVASPINSLLAGEKIQFGAVTSPTILPLGSRAVSNGIVPPGSCRLDVSIDHNLSAAESDCTLFFEKEKHPDVSCVHLEDPEAEAEAAASAVAVAAISSDEIVGDRLDACSVSVSNGKGYGGADIDVSTTGSGVTGDQEVEGQSRGEESLTVALPADLSVETPLLPLWPPLPSPQNSSGHILSHFHGAPPSHFPCYEMNSLLGGPIFAFGPHEESGSAQSQSQKTSTSASGPLGAWQQYHSGVDSFYGPPAGFTGPFISPGGIPGVQGPPHMVVYNHFAPVGQFGQVGLSFMGTTYIPSGKQPDWKHSPTSSAMGFGEGDMNNLNMVSAQRNTPNIPAPIQHLAPGSPLLPMASPLTMFDMSPFQSADIPVQARWSHVSASPLHSVPLSMPLQQPLEGILPPQFSHGLAMDQPSTCNKFHEPHSSAAPDSSRNFPVPTDATATQFSGELGLVDSSSSAATRVLISRQPSNSSTSGRSTNTNAGESGGIPNNMGNSSSQSMGSAFKGQSCQQQTSSSQQYLHLTGYTDQRAGGVSQKVSSGGEVYHRRMGFQGRTQSGTEKNFVSSKMKRIYVAKPSTSGTSTAV